jgi:hypothetical protein
MDNSKPLFNSFIVIVTEPCCKDHIKIIMNGEMQEIKAEVDGINNNFPNKLVIYFCYYFYLKEISAYRGKYTGDIISKQRAIDQISNTNQLKFTIFYLQTLPEY